MATNVRRYEMGKLVTERKLELETTEDLRRLLLDQIAAVVDRKTTPEQAKAICNLSQQVYNTARLELEFAAQVPKQTAPSPLQLARSRKREDDDD